MEQYIDSADNVLLPIAQTVESMHSGRNSIIAGCVVHLFAPGDFISQKLRFAILLKVGVKFRSWTRLYAK